METETEKKERKTTLDYAAEIQRALKPLNYEVASYEWLPSQPLIIKLWPTFPTSD